MLRSFLVGSALAGVLAFGGAASAATVVINTDNSPVRVVPEVIDFSTTGADMVGMNVTATFLSGATETLVWAASGPGAGGVSSSLFSLSIVGDTFQEVWRLVNTADDLLVSLMLDGPSGKTIFDRTEPSTGTESSAQGRDFVQFGGGFPGTINVTYKGAVQVEGFPLVGDVFASLNIDFSGLDAGGIGMGQLFRYRADTDNAAFPTPVPVPASILLFASALGGLGFLARRKAA